MWTRLQMDTSSTMGSTLLDQSTNHQNRSDFLGPFPSAKVVPSFP